MKIKKIIAGLGVLAAALLAIAMLLSPHPVLKVDETKVYSQEAMVYMAIAVKEFEKKGGEEVWELSFDGKKAETAAEEAALESLLQAKLLRFRGETLSSEELKKLKEQVSDLKKILGEEWLKQQKISDGTLAEVLQENYLVWKYKENIPYEEDEIEELTEKKFGEYEEADQKRILTKVRFDSILCYNGMLNGDEWQRFPIEVQEQKLFKMQELQRRLREGEDFDLLKKEYGEDMPEAERRLFYCGIWEDAEASEYLYRGQIHNNIAGRIFRIPQGQISGIMEMPYGYMIVRINEYDEPGADEEQEFLNRLEQAKERFRNEKIEEFRRENLRNEVEQLKKEAEIRLWEERWADMLQKYWDGIL